MTTDAARRAVFDTAELLEKILLHVPIKNIFVSQRVCRQFQDLVKTSVTLRQKLFLRAALPDDKMWKLSPRAEALREPTLISIPGMPADTVTRLLNDSTTMHVKPAELNPFLEFGFNCSSSAAKRLRWAQTERVQLASTTQLRFRQMQDQGLWCSGQLTDPPCPKAEIRAYWTMRASKRNVANGRLDAILEKPDGVTFADLWNALLSAKADHYRTGSQYHNIEESSFFELHERLVQEGYKPVVFKKDDISIDLFGVAIASEGEWKRLRSEQDGRNEQDSSSGQDGSSEESNCASQ